MNNTAAELGELFKTSHHMNQQLMDREIARQGLGELSNPRILAVLRRHSGPMRQNQIARAIGVAPPTVAVSLKRMEKAGLVRKHASGDDLRVNYIELTGKGIEMTDKCVRIINSVHEALFNGFEEAELKIFRGFMRRLVSKAESMNAGDPG